MVMAKMIFLVALPALMSQVCPSQAKRVISTGFKDRNMARGQCEHRCGAINVDDFVIGEGVSGPAANPTGGKYDRNGPNSVCLGQCSPAESADPSCESNTGGRRKEVSKGADGSKLCCKVYKCKYSPAQRRWKEETQAMRDNAAAAKESQMQHYYEEMAAGSYMEVQSHSSSDDGKDHNMARGQCEHLCGATNVDDFVIGEGVSGPAANPTGSQSDANGPNSVCLGQCSPAKAGKDTWDRPLPPSCSGWANRGSGLKEVSKGADGSILCCKVYKCKLEEDRWTEEPQEMIDNAAAAKARALEHMLDEMEAAGA